MQFQIEKYFVSASLYITDYLRSLRVKKFHAYLDERFFVLKPVKKSENLFSVREITGYNNIFTHGAPSLSYLSDFLFRIYP